MKRIVSLLIMLLFLNGMAETALAATTVTETITLPVTNMKVTSSYSSGSYYTSLLTAMKNSAGLSPQRRFVEIAKSQKGYKGSTSKTALDGNGDKGIYTEFSNHRGVAGYDWCAAFVSWCAEAAGLSTSVMRRSNYAGGKISGLGATWADPEGCGTPGTFHRIWSNDFSTYLSDYKPQVGDLCLFMKSENTWDGTSHVEIVISVGDSKNKSGGYDFTTVGRKSGNTVDTQTYSTTANRSSNSSVRKFKGFYTPNWNAASVWSASTVANINIGDVDDYVAPPGKPTLNLSVGSSSTATVFSWARTSNTEYYTLRVYNSNGNQILLEGGITATSYSTKLAAGKYTAKLASVNNTAGVWTFSDVVSFTVTDSTTPGKPTLSVSATGELHETVFSWNATANTEYYTLRIYWDYDTNTQLFMLRGGIRNTSYLANLSSGKYSAILASVNASDGSWTYSNRVYFTVTSQTPPAFSARPVASSFGNAKKVNIYETNQDWMTVRSMLRNANLGHFAYVWTQDDQDVVADAVSAFGKPCWLGGYSEPREGNWYWTYANGMPYTNWASGEPSGGQGKENFIAMLPNGKWIDHCGTCTASGESSSDDIKGYAVAFPVDDLTISVNKDTFYEGWPVERDDLTVLATFEDGETVEVFDYTLSQSSTEAGKQTIKVIYGCTRSVTITYTAQEESEQTALRLPEDLTAIDEETFLNTAAETVYCPEGLTTIGPRSFAECEELRRVFIPASVTSIDATAFKDCGDLWIIAPKGSYAETYAAQHTLKFFADN